MISHTLIMEYLAKTFKIQPVETRKTACLIIFFYAVGFYCMAITAVAFSVFNIRFGARFLPFIFLLFPFIYLFCSIIYIKVLPVTDKKVFFRYFILLALALHLTGLFILNDVFGSSLFYAFLLIIVMFIEDNLLILSVIIVQNVTDIESIKRLLPLTSGSATIGAFSAAVLINNTAHIFTPLQLLSISTLFLVIIAGTADLLLSRHRVVSMEALKTVESGFLATLKYIKVNWFYALLILQVIVVLFVANINDYFYHVIVSNTLGNESAVMAFIGLTGTVQYMFFLIFSFFILLPLVIKAGSLNAVKIVLFSAILASTLMMLSKETIMLALFSKVIFFVLVVGFNASLEQVLYKTVDSRFHDSFIATTDLFVSFAGYITAGLAALLFSYGQVSIYLLSGVSIAVAAIMLAAWHLKQPAFVPALQNTLSFSEDLDVEKLFGQKGIKKFLPQVTKKILDGTPAEKSFALEIIERIDFEEKEELILQAFKKGDLFLKFKILDLIFEQKISGRFLAGLIGAMEPPLQQYLVRQLFMNYREMDSAGLISLAAKEKANIKAEELDEETNFMFEYLFEGMKSNYEKIVAHLISNKNGDNCQEVLQIMNNFTGLEDDCNRRRLPELMQNLKYRQSLLNNCVDLCSRYEEKACDKGEMYLQKIFARCCNYELINKVATYYSVATVSKAFGESELLVPLAYLLYSVGQAEGNAAINPVTLYDKVKDKLYSLIIEKKKIEKASHTARKLILEETDHLIATVSAVLINYLLQNQGIAQIGNLDKHLMHKEKKEMVWELIKNVLPLKTSAEILPLIDEDMPISDVECHYEVFESGDNGLSLASLYRFLGGERLDHQLGEEIKRILVLKSVPIFEELDLEMLRGLLKLANFKKKRAGLAVIRKGEVADRFFIILEGKAGIYPLEGEEAIATIGPGEICGELAVIDGGRRTATVKTLEDLHYLEFAAKDFNALLQRNSTITFAIIKTLSRRLRGMLEPAGTADFKPNI